jgi:hypothetical protein
MLEDAKKKLKDEMDSNKSNSYVQGVGQFLVQYIEAHPSDADKIITKDKSIAKSLDAMRTEAQKKKTGNYAMLTYEEGFSIVLKYFGIDGAPAAASPVTKVEPAPEPKKSIDFDIDLEDLL